MGNPFFDFLKKMTETLQKKIWNRNIYILISNLLLESIFDFGKFYFRFVFKEFWSIRNGWTDQVSQKWIEEVYMKWIDIFFLQKMEMPLKLTKF